MLISQKDRYALRALFELAKRHGGRPIKVAEIAAAQAVPARFLEVILTELKQAGFVTSRRGRYGGYLLAREPADLTIGDGIDTIALEGGDVVGDILSIHGPIQLLEITDGNVDGAAAYCLDYGDAEGAPSNGDGWNGYTVQNTDEYTNLDNIPAGAYTIIVSTYSTIWDEIDALDSEQGARDTGSTTAHLEIYEVE